MLLCRPHLHELAVSSGFCQRKSKLPAELFFDLLFYTVSVTAHQSLSQMVSVLEADFGVNISKQSLDERFNQKSETFVKAVLIELLHEEFGELYSGRLLPGFSRILIKDSTKFMPPTSLESDYRGCGGDVHSRSKSGISIQYEYDLKGGGITDLNITPGNRNDKTDSRQSVDKIKKGDLIIRDLGYFSTPVLKECIEKEAFFLSRLDTTTNVYDTNEKQVSFKEVYKSMKKSGMIEKEMSVYIGKKTMVPVRLILQVVPDEVYAKRIREKTKKSKGQGRGQLTEETIVRSRFTLFITNAQESQLSAKQVFPLYHLRWQIELQFKIWKSVFNIDNFNEMKKYRYTTLLYVKLLWIIINLQITYTLQQAFARTQPDNFRILSLNKSLKTLKSLFNKIFSMLRGTYRKAKEIALYIQNRLSKRHWLESKKGKLCFPQILDLIISVSKR